MPRAVELDDYARDAYKSYVEESDAVAAAAQRRDKAKQALITFLAMAEADVGEVDGVAVLSLTNVVGQRFDVRRFELAEPFKYREYLKTFTYARLTRAGGPL